MSARVRLPRFIEKEIKVVFSGRSVGVKVKKLPESGIVVIKSFHDTAGVVSPAAKAGAQVGDALLSIGGRSVEFSSYKSILAQIRVAPRPLVLRFGRWTNSGQNSTVQASAATSSGVAARSGVAASASRAGANNGTGLKIYTSKDVPVGSAAKMRRQRACIVLGVLVLMIFSFVIGFSNRKSHVPSNKLGVLSFDDIVNRTFQQVQVDLSGHQVNAFVRHLRHHLHRAADEETVPPASEAGVGENTGETAAQQPAPTLGTNGTAVEADTDSAGESF